MFTPKATSATLLLTSLMVAGAIRGDMPTNCDQELSAPEECWYDCETEDDTKSCDILLCPEGVEVCGFTQSDGVSQLTITVPGPDPTGPRVGDHITNYVKGKKVRGTVRTRVYQTISVDSSEKNELLIFVTPKIIRETPPSQ